MEFMQQICFVGDLMVISSKDDLYTINTTTNTMSDSKGSLENDAYVLKALTNNTLLAAGEDGYIQLYWLKDFTKTYQYQLSSEDSIWKAEKTQKDLNPKTGYSEVVMATSGGLRFGWFKESPFDFIENTNETYLTDYEIRSFVELDNGKFLVALMDNSDANLYIIDRTNKT